MLARLFRRKDSQENPPEDDARENLLPSSPDVSIDISTTETKQSRESRDYQIARRTLLLCTAVYSAVGACIALSSPGGAIVQDPDKYCLRHVSQYSPLVNEVKPNWRTVRFNGTFLHENVYRQKAGPEVDAAWNALGINYRSVVIPPDEAEQTGLKPDQVKVAQVYGGGYPANVEGLHHLHCLNLLRQTLKWNYDYYAQLGEGAFTNEEPIVRIHATHCLDILRQQLMCVPDVGVLGQVWWQPASKAAPMPFVDFNTEHRCRDFEGVRKWAEAHQLPPEGEVDMGVFYQMPEPGDTVYVEIPRGLR